MVNGMKTPEKRHFVQSQMNEIFSNVGNHNSQKKLQKPRHSSDQVSKDRNAQIFSGLDSGQQNQKRQNLYREMSGHEINHIESPLVPKCSLFWIPRPEPFERHVDESHQKHIEQEPVQANCRPIVQSIVNLHARSAPSRCRDGKQHSSQSQNLFLALNRRNDSE